MGVRGFQTALAPDAPGEVSDLEAWVDVAVAVRAETGAAAALPVMLVLGALQFRIFSRLVFGWTNADFSTKAVFSAVFIIILISCSIPESESCNFPNVFAQPQPHGCGHKGQKLMKVE